MQPRFSQLRDPTQAPDRSKHEYVDTAPLGAGPQGVNYKIKDFKCGPRVLGFPLENYQKAGMCSEITASLSWKGLWKVHITTPSSYRVGETLPMGILNPGGYPLGKRVLGLIAFPHTPSQQLQTFLIHINGSIFFPIDTNKFIIQNSKSFFEASCLCKWI